jgi:hypothetical protein
MTNLGGYPKDRLGNMLGPDKWDIYNLPSEEQVRRSHSDEYNAWLDRRLEEARARRRARARALNSEMAIGALIRRRHPKMADGIIRRPAMIARKLPS